MARPAPFDALGTATPAQLLALLKMLDVGQQHVAEVLGLSQQLVSFWHRGTRQIPHKYRAQLHTLAADAYNQALAQHQAHAAALPTKALRATAANAFFAPFENWAQQVFYSSGLAEQNLRQILKGLPPYADRPVWTVADLDAMADLCLRLDVALKGWRARQAEAAEAAPGEPRGA